jgi:hypothetical protein
MYLDARLPLESVGVFGKYIDKRFQLPSTILRAATMKLNPFICKPYN